MICDPCVDFLKHENSKNKMTAMNKLKGRKKQNEPIENQNKLFLSWLQCIKYLTMPLLHIQTNT